MRVIPVIDLKRGVAVHAVRGDRERYRPLRSRIAEGSDPVDLTRAVRELPWSAAQRDAAPAAALAELAAARLRASC